MKVFSLASKVGFLSLDPFIDLSKDVFDHPFWNEKRFSIVSQLVKDLGLFESDRIQVFEPREATEKELNLFHTKEYISELKRLSAEGGDNLSFGFGTGDCPIFPKVHESSSMLVGGQLEIIEAILQEEIDHGIALFGGLHHAHHSRASGFCYYNDPVIALKHIKQQKPDWRLLYLDIDCHAGDGTQEAFYDTSQVLTLSLHEVAPFFFPGTGYVNENGEGEGKGYSINIPFPPYTNDSLYKEVFDENIPRIFNLYKPDFIYLQAGTDTHYSDPITHLQLTTNIYRYLVEKIHDLAHKYANGRLFLAGGGGYNPDSTARAWSLMTMILLEQSPPERVPESWLDYCQEWGISANKFLMDENPREEIPEEYKEYSTKLSEVLDTYVYSILDK